MRLDTRSVPALAVDDVEQRLTVEEAAQVGGEQPAPEVEAHLISHAGQVRGDQDPRVL